MSRVLKLYQITDTHASGKDRAVPGKFFSDKGAAKAARKELNGDESDGHIRYVVSPGPDHHNYQKT